MNEWVVYAVRAPPSALRYTGQQHCIALALAWMQIQCMSLQGGGVQPPRTLLHGLLAPSQACLLPGNLSPHG